MTDSIQVLPSGFRVLDASGDPVSGAQIRFWEGGTSTPKTVYSDQSLSTSLGSTVHTRSDGFPVSEEGGSTTVNIYIGSGLYDIDIVDEDDVTIYARKINQKGALDTSTFLTDADASLLSVPVVSTADNLSLTAAYNGKHVRGNTTSQSVTLTLGNAATLTDGWNVEISKAAAANTLRLVTTSSEVINFNGQSHTSLALSQVGEGVSIRCDGAAFYVGHYTPPLRNTVGVIVIADRITSAPGGATPGQRYIVTTGFSTFETEDVIEADAAGGFIEYTPATDCGWIAFVQDEDLNYQFRGTAWAPLAHPASDTVAGIQENATVAECVTGTSIVLTVVPARQLNNPLHPKAWGRSDSTGALGASSGVTSVVKGGTGEYTVTLANAMADTTYGVIVTCQNAGSETLLCAVYSITSATVFVVRTLRPGAGGGSAYENSGFTFSVFGARA